MSVHNVKQLKTVGALFFGVFFIEMLTEKVYKCVYNAHCSYDNKHHSEYPHILLLTLRLSLPADKP